MDLADFDGNTTYAQYNFFSVNNNLTNYRLDIGSYSGNAGDALHGSCGGAYYDNHDGMAFSTYDRDNDRYIYSGNCSLYQSAEWWYNRCECAVLNGPYNGNNRWYGFTNSHKSTEMKLRTRD